MTIAQYIIENLNSFGLNSESDLKLIEKPKSKLEDGGKWLIMLPLRTLPDISKKVTFSNLVENGVKAERFMTVVELELKTRALNSSQDFFWNTVITFRDQVYRSLAGANSGGLLMPRYDWTNPESPVEEGEIKFGVNPNRNSPIEDPLEDPNDSANKSIFLTYNVHWWKLIQGE